MLMTNLEAENALASSLDISDASGGTKIFMKPRRNVIVILTRKT